ncbi:MAG: nicotinamide mononucleotide transporter [Bacteroidales bacterium]|nr:nicotinamide mononucleotide transporter [Bacteroidales bacterium]MBR7175943.1 nicotinamide mononucleotide transporter [Bacteroidales bacterium]
MNYELIIEIVAVITGMLSVWFSKKINVLVFPIGIVSVLLYVFIFIKNELYANAVINFIYFLISVFGWWNWKRTNDKSLKSKGDDELKVTFLNKKESVISSLLVTLSFFIISITINSDLVTKLDYCTSILGLGGIILTSFKKVENWISYLIADIILIPLCIYNGLYLTSIQYLVYTILAIMGYISWSKEARQNV